MRVFVTGASGYIGLAVAKAFRQAGHHVMGLVRTDDKARALRTLEIVPVKGDLGNPSSFQEAAEKAEVLVHCAQERSAQAFVSDAATIDTLIRLAKGAKTPRALLYTSGVWVYGDTKGIVADEASPCHPIDSLKWRPRHEEKILEASCSHIRGVVLRPGCVYGLQGGLTSLWFNTAKNGRVEVIGDGKNRWSMVHLHDLAWAYVLAAEKELSGVVLNISDGTAFTVGEMAHAVAQAAGIGGKVQCVEQDEAERQLGPMVQGFLLDQQISSARATRLLGWRPRHTGFIADAATYYQTWLSSEVFK